MASYDNPGFVSPIPGNPGFVASGTGAQGSASPDLDTDSISGRLEQGTVGYEAVVTPVAASLVNADVVQVGVGDTAVSSEQSAYGPAADPLTGIGAELGETGAGMGHVAGPHHPNSSHPELAP